MSRTARAMLVRTPGTALTAPQGWQLTDAGLVGWTFDNAHVQGGTLLPTAGQLHVARIKASSSVLNNIHFIVTAGGTTLTAGQCFAALCNDAGALLGAGAITASLHGTGANGWADAGFKTHPLSVGQAVTKDAWYKIVWFYNGTTGPTMARAASSNGAAVNLGLAAPNFRFATADTGLTTTPPDRKSVV